MDRRLLFYRFLAALVCFTGMAQERGSITGIVSDPAGAAVPGAKVSAVNMATGVSTTTISNASGNYALLYLIPGTYAVAVQQEGFDKLLRPGLDVRVGDELKLNLTLTIGNVRQTVTVKESTPLLQAEGGDIGETMTQAQIADLPLEDGNPFILAHLAPGAVFTGNPQFTRPFDNGDVSAIRVNGSEGSNEFTINGLPDTGKQLGHSGNVVAYVPPSDAVQEFKMTTSTFSALQGHGTASTINVSTKSGTNSLHGTAYEFYRNELLSANDFFLNRSGQARPVVRYNRFGGSIGGPIWIPRVYKGRNRTFFFFAYENLPDVFPEPNTFTVPTIPERQGDFSALLPAIQIYDPLSAAPTGSGHVQRSPFPNNVIPSSRLDPIALNVIKYYPLPNQPGRSDGSNNYFSPQSRTDKFNSQLARIDHAIGNKQRLSGTYFHNWRLERRFAWAPAVNGVQPTGQDLFRVNHGITLDDVITLSPTTLLDIRSGFNRFETENVPPSLGASPIQLGFSPAVTGLFTGSPYMPPFNISGYTRLSKNSGTSLDEAEVTNTYSFVPTLTKVKGPHTLNLGYEFRSYRENFGSLGNSEGYYDFQDNFTRSSDTGSSKMGQGLAALLLGQPTGGSIDRNGTRANQALYHALFFQDDWKVSPRLTLNLGLRYEYESPATERYNMNVRGFDLTNANPIAAAATAAFANAFPNGLVVDPGKPAIMPADFRVLGGYVFASPSNRGFWNSDPWNVEPRFGFAYQLTSRTVVRGGWAIYAEPLQISGVNQAGFSQTTQLSPTNDNGLTFQANLANPFPGGVLNPPGSRLGMATSAGQSLSFMPLNPKTGHVQRWSFDVQRELPGHWVVDAAYVGSYGYGLSRTSNYLDAVPPQYLSTSPFRDGIVISELTAQVSNPFYGLVPGSSLNTSKTVQVQQLLRPFPEFTGISTSLYNGTNYFNAGELRVEHRFSKGYALWATYTWSKLLERYGFLNDFQIEPTKQVSGNDIPHRVTMTFIGELPFGRGRHWGKNWHGVTNTVLGGWQTQGIFQLQSGAPIGFGDILYFGDPSKLRTHISGSTVDQAFDPSGFYFSDAVVQNPQTGLVDRTLQRNDARINLANNIRTFPSNLPGFRGQGQNNWDISGMKKFSIIEKVTLQFRGEFLNALNHPWFNAPDVKPRDAGFTTITSQRNLAREIQFALKLVF